MKIKIASGFILTALLLVASCNEDESATDDYAALSGGSTTIFSQGPDAFTFPLANLSEEGLQKHLLADGLFGQQFVTAPSTVFGGLGPLFNQNSCESCHVRNGKSSFPKFDNDASSGLLLRIGTGEIDQNGFAIPLEHYGGQLQTKAIFGVVPEATISIEAKEELINYLDGTQVKLTYHNFIPKNTYKSWPANAKISPRMAPAVHGLGLLEAINENDILKNEDVEDKNNDGISGKANRVWNVLTSDYDLGRFGWKAEQPTAAQQAGAAAHDDMGLTNFYFTNETCEDQENCNSGLQTNLDIDEASINLMTFYFQTLAVPARRNINQNKNGEKLFHRIGCNSCHTPSYKTNSAFTSELSYQIIYPYTDLLLHDMGEALSDNRPTFLANGNEWRTPALWGIGLTQIVNPKATFLHDGRAKTIEEAILWHGGEAEQTKQKFLAFTLQERKELISFINSL